MIDPIAKHELRIGRPGRIFRLGAFLFAFFFAFFALAANASAQNLEYLAEQIRDGNTEQKRNALFEIRNRRAREASRVALPALRDNDAIVRASAAFSVIFLPSDEAFAALAPNLLDKSEFVRRETAYALGKIQNPAATALLIQTFQKDKSAEVRNACVIALGDSGDAAAVDFLTQILRRRATAENEFPRRAAARAVGQIAQFTQIRESRAVTPESFLPENYKLLTLGKYENLSVRFSQFGAAVPVLTQILQSRGEADDLRREAAFALGAIAEPAALPVLQTAAGSKDYYLAEIARESIKKISTVDSVE